MLDVISVVMSTVSVFQGWPNKDKSEQNKVLEHFFEDLRTLDSVLFTAKNIHDNIDGFYSKSGNSHKVLNQKYEDLSETDIKRHIAAYRSFLRDTSSSFPEKIDELSGDKSLVNDLTPELREAVLKLYRHYGELVQDIPALEQAKSSLDEVDYTNLRDTEDFIKSRIKEVDRSLSELYTNADKTIMFCASLTAHIHHQARDAVKGGG